MTRSPGDQARRSMPWVRRLLYLSVVGAGAADALGVGTDTRRLTDFGADVVERFEALADHPEFRDLGDADREGAEAAFAEVVEQSVPIDVWRGVIDGADGIRTRMMTSRARTRRADLASTDAQAYFDRLVLEACAQMARWLEQQPIDGPSLVLAMARELRDQNAEVLRLVRDLESLSSSTALPSPEVSRDRLRVQTEWARSLLAPEVLPYGTRATGIDPASLGGGDAAFPLVLLGDGGLGKSVLAGEIVARQREQREVVLVLATRVPAGADLATAPDVDRALGAAAYGQPDAPPLSTILDRTFSERPLVVVDTVDLLLSDRSADALAQAFAMLVGRCDLVATCRTREWHSYLATDASTRWHTSAVAGLEAREIVAWTSRYLESTDLAADTAAGFLRSIHAAVERDRFVDVLRVPLRLAMTCQIYGTSGGLPADLTVTSLYRTYWERRIGSDRRGRQGDAALLQEEATLSLAGQLWHASRTRFSETVAADQATIRACRALVSDGILKHVGPRYAFFHQTFAEFSVARFLAARGTAEDWTQLEIALAAGSAGHWGAASHLVVDDLDPSLFLDIAAHVPRDRAEGVRLLLRGLWSREPGDPERDLLRDLASDPAGLVAASDVLALAPASWVSSVIPHTASWLADPAVRDGRLVNAVGDLLRRLPASAQAEQLVAALRALTSAEGRELASQARTLVQRTLLDAPPDGPEPCQVMAVYPALPDAARAELLAIQAARADDRMGDLAVLGAALDLPRPSNAIDSGTDLLERTWLDPEARADLGWSSWRDLLMTPYDGPWNACQVRAVARLAERDPALLEAVMAAALDSGEKHRDRLHNVAHFLAESRPAEVARILRSDASAPSRAIAGTVAVVARSVASHLAPAERVELYDLLLPYAALDPRRTWPAILRIAATTPGLLDRVVPVVETQVLEVRRSAFDALLQEVGPGELVVRRADLVRLVPGNDPEERLRRARLDGFLALSVADARTAIDRHLRAQPGAKEPLAATTSLAETVAAWDGAQLDPARSDWLVGVLLSRHAHAVRTLARALRSRHDLVRWTPRHLSAVTDRFLDSLRGSEDAQVAETLVELLGSIAHDPDPDVRALVGPATVRIVLDRYVDVVLDHVGTLRPDPRLPAFYVQLHQTITRVAAPVLGPQEAEAYLVRSLLEIDTALIGGRSARALASALVGFTDAHPGSWGTLVDAHWSRIPAANQQAAAESLARGHVPGAATYARAIRARDDCSPEVATILLATFPD